jgi:hypothetical protein
MTSPVKHLLAALAILALGTSQLLGLARGWVCLCSGEAVMANAPDCSAADCHHDDEPQPGEHDERDHEHDQLTQPLLGRDFVPLALQLPLLVEFEIPPVFAWKPHVFGEAMKPSPAHPLSGCGPPWGVLVARTVVLLV